MSKSAASSVEFGGGGHRAGAFRFRTLPAWWPWVGLAVLLAGAVATLMYQGRGGGFYYDDWDFVLRRRDWNTLAVLGPHNEHLSLVPVLFYKLLFVTVGLDAYPVYRLGVVLAHAGTLAAMFVYARPRVGPALALLVPASVAIFGAAYIDLLWAFQLGYAASLLTGVLAFIALDRHTRRGDMAACALVCISLGSSSVGICVLCAVALEVLGSGWRRRWWMIAVPVALYAGWYLKYQEATSTISLGNVLAVTQFSGQGLAATAGGLAGLTIDWGRPIAFGAVCLLVWRARSYATVPWRLVALLAVPLSFWAFASFARANLVGAETPRYLYPPAVFLLMAGVEAGAGGRLRGRGVALAAVLVLTAGLTNLTQLRAGGRDLAAMAVKLYGTLGALEVAGDRIEPGYQPAPSLSPQVMAGPYRDAVADLGPIVGGEAGVLRSEEAAREFADGAMQVGLKVAAVEAGSGPGPGAPPAVDSVETAAVTRDPQCLRAAPQGASGAVAVTLPDAGVVIYGAPNTSVMLRLWGDAFVNGPLAVDSAKPVLIRIPEDGARAVWHARIAFSTPVRICGAV